MGFTTYNTKTYEEHGCVLEYATVLPLLLETPPRGPREVIFCIGETLEERDGNQTDAVCERQLAAVFPVPLVADEGKQRHLTFPPLSHSVGLSAVLIMADNP